MVSFELLAYCQLLSLQDFLCCLTVQRLDPACLVRAGRPGTNLGNPAVLEASPLEPLRPHGVWRCMLALPPRENQYSPAADLLFSDFPVKFYPPTSNPSKTVAFRRFPLGSSWEEPFSGG